ncbi:hypothetical protein Hdeb2414_s0004g00131391 [Helianthus debilis subsp. tardiflorus]
MDGDKSAKRVWLVTSRTEFQDFDCMRLYLVFSESFFKGATGGRFHCHLLCR